MEFSRSKLTLPEIQNWTNKTKMQNKICQTYARNIFANIVSLQELKEDNLEVYRQNAEVIKQILLSILEDFVTGSLSKIPLTIEEQRSRFSKSKTLTHTRLNDFEIRRRWKRTKIFPSFCLKMIKGNT